MNEELNQKIHKWRGLCWHLDSVLELPDGKYCCDRAAKYGYAYRTWVQADRASHAYTTDPAAMLELIEAVRAKGFDVEMFSDADEWLVCMSVTGSGANEIRCVADTLPMAVAKAVEKLIDAEGK